MEDKKTEPKKKIEKKWFVHPKGSVLAENSTEAKKIINTPKK